MRADEEHKTRDLINLLEWIPVDTAVAERAGSFALSFRRSHPGIDVADYAIAATAILERAELWTRNVRHFPMFPDLEPPY